MPLMKLQKFVEYKVWQKLWIVILNSIEREKKKVGSGGHRKKIRSILKLYNKIE